MKITTEMVDYVSELSRLSLPEAEKAEMAEKLEQIIDYVEILNRLDTEGVEPMSHTFPVKNVLREDEVVDFGHHAELMGNAPAHDESAFLVPKTVE
ncbi:MAG: Asp-tRNA(Asn)/Glu-tRNA(Gln) amidotransferase GatCAB subunit C [Clostridiales bacterium]|jgi:aspartyl-tRNA(Asn)/glutamyl-tRNA(Gln) amidotransferase subunit C|nr:MAG: Asp-tRNA(Asn)/Glu-tRNA(Gln) amidotransferase GatCAB subunit C [Clostridiales bacterium]